jgi:chromosome condensin MukBEF ATPase and DNA-binding subunit MukB
MSKSKQSVKPALIEQAPENQSQEAREREQLKSGLWELKPMEEELQGCVYRASCWLAGMNVIEAGLNRSGMDYRDDEQVREFMAFAVNEMKDEAEKLNEAFNCYIHRLDLEEKHRVKRNESAQRKAA